MADFKAALERPEPAVIDCFAVWCGPCKTIAPKIVEYAKKYPSARFYKVDVDEVPDVAQELAIRAMPTVKVFKGGEEVDSVVGAMPQLIEEAVIKVLAEGAGEGAGEGKA